MCKVLLVDDEPAILDMEKRAITNRVGDFTVVGEAYGVETAKTLFEREKPEVVLTDIKMPNQTGIELIKYIMGRESKATITVAVSGYEDFDYVHDAFMYGAFDYLLKPVEPKKIADLFARIRGVLAAGDLQEQTVKIEETKTTAEEMVTDIAAFVEQNLEKDNSIYSICNLFGISQPYLSRIFKSCKNTTYNDFLIGLRIDRAKEYLKQHDRYLVGEIAEIVGFSDQFYFSKVFKNITGFTPREYRKIVD